MSGKHNYTIETEQNTAVESEFHREVPIIDIVRHGPTEYKELRNKGFKFNPGAEDFALDEEHLDITTEGIRNIEETAEQLIHRIDKNKELVLLVTSPNYRAHSSALVIENSLRRAGISFLGDYHGDSNVKRKIPKNNERIPAMRNLRQIGISPNFYQPDWTRADKEFRQENPRNITVFPWDAYREIIKRMGKNLDDVFTEGPDEINLRFNRFVRHINNLYRHLAPEVLEKIKGKRLRVIALTHEEVPAVFAKNALNINENIRKGQILEIRPETQMSHGSKVPTRVELIQKSDASGACKRVKRGFELPSG